MIRRSQNLLYRYITQGRVESDRTVLFSRRLTRFLLTHSDKLAAHYRERTDAATDACLEMTVRGVLIGDFAALSTPEPGNDEHLASWSGQDRAENLLPSTLLPAVSNSTGRL